jgi:hypothetical protein
LLRDPSKSPAQRGFFVSVRSLSATFTSA